MKTVHWVGGLLSEVQGFPDEVRGELGFELYRVQAGLDPRDYKPMPIVGAGTREIRVRAADGAWRMFYVVEKGNDVYVLHAFQKKTQRTSQQDIDLGKARYKLIP